MSEFTPTTDQVRNEYTFDASAEYNGTDHAAACIESSEREFDRWLAAHDAEIAARAWDEAIASLIYLDGTSVEIIANDNPYRTPKETS